MTAALTRRGSRGHRPGIATVALVVLAALAVGCGDDVPGTADEGDEVGGDDTGPDDQEAATVADIETDDIVVNLDATARQDDEDVTVTFDFTVTNTTDEPVLIDDITDARQAQLDDTVLRARYRLPFGDPSSGGGGALPMLDGTVLDAGATLGGTMSDRSRYREVDPPTSAEICIEVRVDGFTVEADGTAVAPYRQADEAATVACSGPVPLG